MPPLAQLQSKTQPVSRRQSQQATRARLLEVGRRHFLRDGLGGAVAEAIAAEAGYRPGARSTPTSQVKTNSSSPSSVMTPTPNASTSAPSSRPEATTTFPPKIVTSSSAKPLETWSPNPDGPASGRVPGQRPPQPIHSGRVCRTPGQATRRSGRTYGRVLYGAGTRSHRDPPPRSSPSSRRSSRGSPSSRPSPAICAPKRLAA